LTDLLTACWISSEGAPQYFAAAREREAIRRRRAAGEPPPWTQDKALAEWRFCNVFREHDKTTVWFREEVRKHLDGVRAVEATAIFRWFNRIEVGELIKDLLLNGWNAREARKRLRKVVPVTNAAYMVNTPVGLAKLDGVLECVRLMRRRWMLDTDPVETRPAIVLSSSWRREQVVQPVVHVARGQLFHRSRIPRPLRRRRSRRVVILREPRHCANEQAIQVLHRRELTRTPHAIIVVAEMVGDALDDDPRRSPHGVL